MHNYKKKKLKSSKEKTELHEKLPVKEEQQVERKLYILIRNEGKPFT